MTTIRFTVLTPMATVLEWDVESVTVPLADGWRGLLPGHARFQARLLEGEVLVRMGGRERLVATLGGALSVQPDGIVVLTGAAALDQPFDRLRREVDDDTRRRTTLEQEAEKQFDRVYRAMARALDSRRERRS